MMYKHTLCFIKRNEEILMLPKLLPEVLHNGLILKHNFVLSNHK
jgi:hypothetical protein